MITVFGNSLDIILIVKFLSFLLIAVILLGFIFGGSSFLLLGIILVGVTVLFQIVTLPVEFNASRRALTVIEETGMLEEIENARAKQVLTAAAMTYVAAALTALLQLARVIMLARRRR